MEINPIQEGLESGPGLPWQHVQKCPETGQDLPQVVACTAEEGVDRIARHALEEVPPEKSITFHVADLGFDGGPPPQVAFEGITELARAADEDPAPARVHAVSLVPLVHEGGAGSPAGEAFHLVELSLQRVPIEGIAGQVWMPTQKPSLWVTASFR